MLELATWQALIEAARGYETPFVLVDRRVIAEKYSRIRAAVPGVEVHYAVKANPHAGVIATLAELGCGFEIASLGELDLLTDQAVPADRIVSSNPIKASRFIAGAHAYGIDRFAFDSSDEVIKLAKHAPGCRVYCRLTVDNTGSDWPLSLKYGVDTANAVRLLVEAADAGLRPDGVTFHVGSQCLNLNNWRSALATSADVWRGAAAQGVRLRLLNLGGGLPVQHLKPIPSLTAVGDEIVEAVGDYFPPDVALTMEPGRALVADAAVMVTSVIGKADRGRERWLYLDAGVFNGLMETIANFGLQFWSENRGPTRAWTVAGPSCDSVDMMTTDAQLPDLAVGDRVYVVNAGAYTLSYASSFNGFPPPAVHFLDGALIGVRFD